VTDADVQRLADRFEIENLLARYSMARDDGDLPALLATFAADAEFVQTEAAFRGLPEIEAMFRASFERFGLTLHTVHLPVIEVLGPDSATGVVNGHAELVIGNAVHLAAYRYTDAYRQVAGRWLIARRHLRFRYAVPADRYPAALASTLPLQWPDAPHRRADFPNPIDTEVVR